jgi:hypothetical protein
MREVAGGTRVRRQATVGNEDDVVRSPKDRRWWGRMVGGEVSLDVCYRLSGDGNDIGIIEARDRSRSWSDGWSAWGHVGRSTT